MKRIALAIFCCLGMFAATAQTTFSLEEAMDYAAKNHVKLKTAAANMADAEYQIKEAVSVAYPQINADIGITRYLQLPSSVIDASAFSAGMDTLPPPDEQEVRYLLFPAGVENSVTANVELTQLLVDFTYFVSVKATKKLISLTQKQTDLTIVQLRNNVRDAYLPNLIIDVNEEILTKNMDNLKKTLFETKEMYKNGFVEQLDIDRLELSLANLEIQLNTLKDQKRLTQNVLKYQMNFPMDQEIMLSDDIDKLMASAGEVDLEGEEIYKNRLEFDLFKERQEINAINIQRLRAGYLPNLVGFASYQQSLNRSKLFEAPLEVATDEKIGFIPAAVVGLQMNIPIFDGFKKKYGIQRAKVAMEKIKIEEEELRQGIELQVKNARVSYKVAEGTVNTTKKSLDLAERIHKTTKVKYKEGVGSSSEVYQAEQALYSSQANHLSSIYDLLVAKAELDKALGL